MSRRDPSEKIPVLGYLAADDHDRPRWDLFVYLLTSYAIAYAVHFPLFDRWDRVLIPAALPWAIAAAVALWQYRRGLPRFPAWATLVVGMVVFIAPRLLR